MQVKRLTPFFNDSDCRNAEYSAVPGDKWYRNRCTLRILSLNRHDLLAHGEKHEKTEGDRETQTASLPGKNLRRELGMCEREFVPWDIVASGGR